MKPIARALLKNLIFVLAIAFSAAAFAENRTLTLFMPSEAHLLVLRPLHLRPISLTGLTPSPALKGSDAVLVARGNHIIPSRTFGWDLIQKISAQLDAAGLYDAKADTVLSGVLLENSMTSTSGPDLNGRIAVRLKLDRSGVVLFEKEFSAEAAWKSPPDDFRTISDAVLAYTKLYKSISLQLLSDPQFQSALAPSQ